MIRHIYVNGIQVDNDKTFLAKLGNTSGAAIEFADYQRGGASGQILSRPLYRGLSIGMKWFVKGESVTDFIAQRDRLIGYFQNRETTTNYTKTLGIELVNGVVKEIDVLFSTVNSDLEPGDIISDEFDLTAVSEKEYLIDRATKTATLNLLSLGGMPIPTGIVMTMANSPVGEAVDIINAGNANAYPTITVTGAFASGFTLTNSTASTQLEYTGALLVSDTVVIDLYNRTAIKNATTNVLSGISGDWLKLLPGSNVITITGGEGDSGSAVVSYHDTYRNI